MSTSVIKLGGNVLKDDPILHALLEAVSTLQENGHDIVFVHGGGSQADDLHEQLDVPIEKVNGRRITDADSLEISKMVYRGTLNVNLVSDCLEHDISAVGITGVDGTTVEVQKRPPMTINRGEHEGDEKTVDFGFVGDIVQVHPDLVHSLLDRNMVPIVGRLVVDEDGQVYNVNADTMAAAVAAGLSGDRLVYVTSVEGVMDDPEAESVLSSITLTEADELIDNGTITEGMIPKMDSARQAIRDGVNEVLIAGSLQSDDAWREAILNGAHGTTIRP